MINRTKREGLVSPGLIQGSDVLSFYKLNRPLKIGRISLALNLQQNCGCSIWKLSRLCSSSSRQTWHVIGSCIFHLYVTWSHFLLSQVTVITPNLHILNKSRLKNAEAYQHFKDGLHTVYPKKYAHGFVVLCFVVVMQSFIMNSHEVFIHIHQGCFAGTGAIVRFPQCQWSKPDGYGKISQCITTTKHSKAKTVCIFLGIYCIARWSDCYCGDLPLDFMIEQAQMRSVKTAGGLTRRQGMSDIPHLVWLLSRPACSLS